MATLEQIIDELEAMSSENVGEMLAEKGAARLEEALKATLSAGETPDGAPWAPKKRGGGRPYANAAAKLTVKAFGLVIRAKITGPEVFGHYGAKGAPVRQMLPDGGAAMPASVTKALELAADDVMRELTK